MKIYDIIKGRRKAVISISKYGFFPEHNYYNYLYLQGKGKKGFFFDFGEGKGLIAFHNQKNSTWRIINGIFAPSGERLKVLLDFIDWAFREKGSKRIFAELPEELKTDAFRKLRGSYRLNTNYLLHWPVYNLEKLDEKLAGKKWKKLRNINNRFCKSFRIAIKDPRKVSREVLKGILLRWTRRRYPRDRANYGYYTNLIGENFKGLDVIRAVSLDGEVCAFSGGWAVPNSKTFYSGVGIFDYKHKDLGDFVNLDDLLYLKRLGYRHVDLGGSEESLLNFKKKFGPEKIHKTYVFSISPKN
ncbi:DUF2156 domain-containing protein [Candidatus Woesearchaeota archaeon]|nr:DUF2156 domain-containing protein [Candidatus Woesearchaeota archaeon]